MSHFSIFTCVSKFFLAIAAIDMKLLNVIILSLCFMFLNSVYQATSNIQKTIFDRIAKEDPSFTGDGYISLSIGNAGLSLSYLLTPSFALVVKSRLAILIGSLSNAFYMCSFLWPEVILMYSASAIQGLGYGLAWIGATQYIVENSNSTTVSQKFGIFYGINQLSNIVGNLIVYFSFTGTTYDKSTRELIFTILVIFSVISVVFAILLRKPPQIEKISIEPIATVTKEMIPENREILRKTVSTLNLMMEGLKSLITLIITTDINLLLPIFVYSGLIFSFNSGIFTACVGFTKKISSSPEKLISVMGICIGFGEILGSIFFKCMASRVKKIFGLNWIITMGVLTHIFSFILILVNLPDDSPFKDTENVSFISPSPILAMISAFTLGFGDACFNIQIFACLTSLYPNDNVAANSYYNFWQSVAMSTSYFYSNYFGLHLQLGILQFTVIFGTILYSIIIYKNKTVKNIEMSSVNS
ncbi:UNC93-like protein MFSD11 [Belonocnema kinseyi]|uniref:UNC93-like protein MFSD11 n=1 Tax=Belonocnema kinseyi TaxID=2817044 RepID=UPI00143D94E0|nr:UNC93-like protein MFSD11 [Belonocnema kinseyi]